MPVHGAPQSPEVVHAEHAQSAAFLHVARDLVQPVPIARQRAGLSQHHSMLSVVTQRAHEAAGAGVGGAGVGAGVGGAGVGVPPHVASAHVVHAQYVGMLHVARGRLQPSPGLRQ